MPGRLNLCLSEEFFSPIASIFSRSPEHEGTGIRMTPPVTRIRPTAFLLCLAVLMIFMLPAAASPLDEFLPVQDLPGSWTIETVVPHWATYAGDLGIDGRYLAYAI